MKRLLSLALVICIALTMLPLSAYASEVHTAATGGNIQTGEGVELTLDAGESATLSFTPTESGSYAFYMPGGDYQVEFVDGMAYTYQEDFYLEIHQQGRKVSHQMANMLEYSTAVATLEAGTTYQLIAENWAMVSQITGTVYLAKLEDPDQIRLWCEGPAVMAGDYTSILCVPAEGLPFINVPISWEIEDESIVTLDYLWSNSITVCAVSEGSTKITATLENGAKATYTISVVPDYQCGDNLTWFLWGDINGGLTLCIDGNGAMYNFERDKQPWYPHIKTITDVALPQGITHLGDYAFMYSRISEVTVPDSVTSLGSFVFFGCTRLTDVTLPNHITELKRSIFFDCLSLAEIDLPDALETIGDYAFENCISLTHIDIPDGVTILGDCAFNFCEGLSSVELPENLIKIGNSTFANGSNLKEIHIPAKVREVGSMAFTGSVKDVYFYGPAPTFSETAFMPGKLNVHYPASDPTWTEEVRQDYEGDVTWIPLVEEVDSGWSGSTQWTLTSDGTLTVYGSGNMKNYGYNGGQPWLGKGVDITSVVIEEGVTGIGTGAFRNLTFLESITLPERGLSKIGEAAFYGCTSLKSIDIPEGIYTIWSYTFKGCSALESVKLPKTLIKVDQGAFENCTALPYIFIPTNTQIIGSWSFKGCTGLKEADMTWADATEVREGAFKNCSALTTIHLPVNIQILGDSCFYGIGAASFTVPETVTSIKPWCFARSALKEIVFEGDAPTIGTGAFNKITLTARYPKDNATWTSAVKQNYGGTVTWEAK